MNKGDKYIIEIDEVQQYHDDNGKVFELGKVKGFHALTLDEAALKKLEPVSRGKWRDYEGMLTCSACGAEIYNDIEDYLGYEVPHYCPNCGARMDGEKK